jgi:hypothetical protein
MWALRGADGSYAIYTVYEMGQRRPNLTSMILILGKVHAPHTKDGSGIALISGAKIR